MPVFNRSHDFVIFNNKTISIILCLRFAIGFDVDLDLNLSFTREGDVAKGDDQGTGDKTQQKSNYIVFISCTYFEKKLSCELEKSHFASHCSFPDGNK